MANEVKRPSERWTLFTVFLCLLVDLLGFTVILPLIPSMLEYYSTHDQVYSYMSLYAQLRSLFFCISQSGLYDYLLKTIDGFRLSIGAPDSERFNLVLFGGTYVFNM